MTSVGTEGLKITGIDAFESVLTYVHGDYAMSGGRVAAHQASTLVRIRTNKRIEGWGESCPLGGTYLPAFPGSVRAALREIGPAIVGLDPRDIGVIQARMASTLRGFNEAKSAIDIACWDILGRATGLPVSTLLGGVRQEMFPIYEAVPLGPPERMAEFVAMRREVGITCFQIKVGNDPLDDIARARSAVEAGGDARFICDANGGWRLQDAITAVSGLRDLPVYIEQPCMALEDMGRLREVTWLPLVADESVVDVASLYAAREIGHAGSVNLKLARLGGITPARLLRDTAVNLGMTVTIEDTWGGDVATAAVSHLAATTAAGDLLSTSFFNDWTAEHVAPSVRPRSAGGYGSAPAMPGLGVEVAAELLGKPLFSIE